MSTNEEGCTQNQRENISNSRMCCSAISDAEQADRRREREDRKRHSRLNLGRRDGRRTAVEYKGRFDSYRNLIGYFSLSASTIRTRGHKPQRRSTAYKTCHQWVCMTNRTSHRATYMHTSYYRATTMSPGTDLAP